MENLSLEERLSKNAVNKLVEAIELNEIEQAKIEYGVAVLLINLFKVVIIYLTSFSLNVLFPTLVTHSLFCLMRRYCNGYHAKSSINCTVISVTCFSIIPWGIQVNNLGINLPLFFLLGGISGIILFLNAPRNTSFTVIDCAKRRAMMKRKTLILLLFLLIGLATFCCEQGRLLGISGIVSSAIFTLPIEKILEGVKIRWQKRLVLQRKN